MNTYEYFTVIETIGEDKGKLVTGIDYKADGLELREPWRVMPSSLFLPWDTNCISWALVKCCIYYQPPIQHKEGRRNQDVKEKRCPQRLCSVVKADGSYPVQHVQGPGCMLQKSLRESSSLISDLIEIAQWLQNYQTGRELSGESLSRKTDRHAHSTSKKNVKQMKSQPSSSFTGKADRSDKGSEPCFAEEM